MNHILCVLTQKSQSKVDSWPVLFAGNPVSRNGIISHSCLLGFDSRNLNREWSFHLRSYVNFPHCTPWLLHWQPVLPNSKLDPTKISISVLIFDCCREIVRVCMNIDQKCNFRTRIIAWYSVKEGFQFIISFLINMKI